MLSNFDYIEASSLLMSFIKFMVIPNISPISFAFFIYFSNYYSKSLCY